MTRTIDDVYYDVLEHGLFLSEDDFQLALRDIRMLEDDDMRTLLRKLLVQSGTFQIIDEGRQEKLDLFEEISASEYEHRLRENANQKAYREWLQSKGLPEEDPFDLTPPWEGMTWVIDLALSSPNQALQVIEAYIQVHYWALPSGRLKAQEDAASLIRSRYIGLPEHADDRIKLLLERQPRDLEILAARLYEAIGYEVAITKQTRDGGRDLVALRTEAGQREHLLVECKRWGGTVDVDVPRNLLGVLSDEKAGKGVVIATSAFSPDAQAFAARNPRLELIDGKLLVLLLNEHLGFDWPLHIERLSARPVRSVSDDS